MSYKDIQQIIKEIKEQEQKEAEEFQKKLEEAGFKFSLKNAKIILEIAHEFLEEKGEL